MDQISHLLNNQDKLIARFEIIKAIREFFWSENFLEVETPLIVRYPGQEPYLSPMKVKVNNEKGESFDGYLHTSPEYAMKKMLAAGFDNIFSICKTFRDEESFGGTHNPEFTMIEWYRKNADYFNIMDDTENLFKFISTKKISGFDEKFVKKIQQPWLRKSMKEIWQEFVGVNLDEYLTTEKMAQLCREKGLDIENGLEYEDYFYALFLNLIEPKLGFDAPVFIYLYPKQMAALAKFSAEDSRYAERFELYIDGLELANAFSELTEAKEQRERLLEERALRGKLGKEIFALDEDFLQALEMELPKMAGIALGVDRLIQIFLACKNIDNVLTLPMSKLFN
jgi:lysyl-tRNA synthetase class 2